MEVKISEQPVKVEDVKKWYKTWWGIIGIFLLWPILLPLIIWKYTNWSKAGKIAAISLVVLVFISLPSLLVDTLEEGQTVQESKNNQTGQQEVTEKKQRFEGRADAQDKDIELLVKESEELEGMKLLVTKVESKIRLSEYNEAESGKEFVIVYLSFENVSNETIPYNGFDFRIQTAGGQVLDQSFSSAEDRLGSGDLVSGGKHSGTVTFEVPKEPGYRYILYKPNSFKSDRIVVQIQ